MADGFYNVVLRFDDSFEKLAVNYAQLCYTNVHNGYCLSLGHVFPHITLCQFKCIDENVVKKLGEHLSVYYGMDLQLSFSGFYANFYESDPDKGFWLGLEVVKTPDLSFLQKKIHDILTTYALEPLNPTLEEYWPHMTFARIGVDKNIAPHPIPKEFFGEVISGLRLSIGRSDSSGQYLG